MRFAPCPLFGGAALQAALLAALPFAVVAQEAPVAEIDGVRVSGAWTEAGDGPSAEVYMRIENTGSAPVTLAEVGAPEAEMGTVVASPERSAGGVPETLDGILLPPGVATTLEPEGLHVLLSGLDAPREAGGTLDLTLTFESLGALDVPVAVVAEGAGGPD